MTSVSPVSVVTQGVGNTILPPKRCRSWCFTLNNHTEKDISLISHLFESYKIIKIIFQEEMGKNGTPHLQGVIQFKNQFLFSKLKEILPTAHLEKCRSLKASIKYCSKEDTRSGIQFTYGVKKKELWQAELTQEEILEWCKDNATKNILEDEIYTSVMSKILDWKIPKSD